LKLVELPVVAFAQFANKSERTIVTLWILITKKLFLVAITFSQLAKDASIVPSFNSYFMSIERPTVVLKRFFRNYLSELCSRDICNHLWLLLASSEYWEVKSISCWGCIVFHHCDGKDSKETIRCSYQAKLN